MMNCLDFRRLCLSEPNSSQANYLQHNRECAECSDYAKSVRVLDQNIKTSLDIFMPEEFKAKLKLRQTIESETQTRHSRIRYAIAASLVIAMIASVLMFQKVDTRQDYNSLLAGIVEHLNDTPDSLNWVWADAQQQIKLQLASYDENANIAEIKGLRFSRICPMGQYRGLHAMLETEQGLVTFAYIKGDKFEASDLLNYGGYVSKVVPMGNGNLIIVSETQQALPEAENNIVAALSWDI